MRISCQKALEKEEKCNTGRIRNESKKWFLAVGDFAPVFRATLSEYLFDESVADNSFIFQIYNNKKYNT